MKKEYIGNDFDDFLREENLLEASEVTAATLLSQHPEFTLFLDERFAEKATIPLEELESEAS